MPTPSTQPTSSNRSTATLLYVPRKISNEAIAAELLTLGDSTDEKDCLLRTALMEVLHLRTKLTAEQSLLDALEAVGLQTTGSIFGVHCASVAPSFLRRWICWQGSKHTSLRSAIQQMITLQKKARR